MSRNGPIPQDETLRRRARHLYVDPLHDERMAEPPPLDRWIDEGDGRHIVAMGLELHPLLGRNPELVNRIRYSIAYGSVVYEPRTLLGPEHAFEGLMYLRDGKARVLLQEGPVLTELWRFGCGAWLGMPRLWLEWLRHTGEEVPPELERSVGQVSVEIMEKPMRLEEPFVFDVLPLDTCLALMAEEPDFRNWVENQVVVGLLRAREFDAIMADHPVLGSLRDEDQALLLQFACLRRYTHMHPSAGEPKTPRPYLDPDDERTSRRVAMILDGVAHQYSRAQGERDRTFVGEARRGEMVGLGGIVREEDVRLLEENREKFESGEAPLFSHEEQRCIRKAPMDPHQNVVWLGDDTEFLEWDRVSLRWMLGGRLDTWVPAVRYLGQGARTGAEDQAEVTVMCGQRDGLGATSLALGTAAALARSAYDEGLDRRHCDERVVWLMLVALPEDLVPSDDWLWKLKDNEPERLEIRSFRQADGSRLDLEILDLPVRRDTPGLYSAENSVDPADQIPAVPNRVRVTWLNRLALSETLVNLLRTQPHVSDVLVVFHASDDPRVRHYMEHLIQRRTRVVWLHEDPWHEELLIDHAQGNRNERLGDEVPVDLPGLPRVMPRELIRTDRVNAHYQREARGYTQLPQEVDPLVSERRRSPWAHVLRVHDDKATAERLRALDLDAVLDGHRDHILARAFWRLKRMIRNRTVGVALGGGGVYGCAHIALLEHLRDKGIPVDYVAGASYGALVSGLYAAGQHDTIADFLERNPAPPDSLPGPLQTLYGSVTSQAFTSLLASAAYDSVFFENMLDTCIEGSVPRPEFTHAACTEIPFLAVGVDIATRTIAVARSGTIGWAIRVGCCLPPVFPAILPPDGGRDDSARRYIDGAILANVPVDEIRYTGADFVIACNVVPPLGTVESGNQEIEYREPKRVHKKTTWLLRTLARNKHLPPIQTLSSRVRDTISAAWSVLWKVGMDQSLNKADYCVDLWTVDVSMGSMWWAQRVRADSYERMAEAGVADEIARLWEEGGAGAAGVLYRRIKQ